MRINNLAGYTFKKTTIDFRKADDFLPIKHENLPNLRLDMLLLLWIYE